MEDLSVVFHTEKGTLLAVDQISFNVERGKTLAIVGESGCGKSVTSLAILRLLPQVGEISQGELLFSGKSLLQVTKENMRSIRGKKIAMVFQEPMTALNPVYTVGQQVTEAITIHNIASSSEAKKLAIEMLVKVKIPDPVQRFDEYPFQLSGGMKQRVLIAIALACNPSLLICDEPTTALDVTVQAQILELMKELQESMNMGMIFITHDLGVVAEVADEVAVMYAGRIVEKAPVFTVYDDPRHPYTKGLLSSIPQLTDPFGKKLKSIKGQVPSFFERPKGCNFNTRCPFVIEKCFNVEPQTEQISSDHEVQCHRFKELKDVPFAEG